MFKNRKNNKKGFTLVEVIVVLVILAILAAIMIPALTGWIDKANKKTAVVEARTALLALQTEVAENYTPGSKSITITKDGEKLKVGDVDVTADYNGLVGDDNAAKNTSGVDLDKTKVKTFKYVSSTGYEVTYAGGKFTVADK